MGETWFTNRVIFSHGIIHPVFNFPDLSQEYKAFRMPNPRLIDKIPCFYQNGHDQLNDEYGVVQVF